MPKSNVYTKEVLLEAALKLVRREGAEVLTARSLAKEAGCSVCPVFTAFDSMGGLKAAVVSQAKKVYDSYVACALSKPMPFKSVGEAYIKFAAEEPKLFQLLFMSSEHKMNLDVILPTIDDNYEKILDSVKSSYGLSDVDALRIYKRLWIFTHGIATLCATGVNAFTDEQTEEMISDVFVALLMKIKGEKI